jgi:GT2 family glycosyltransferase
MKVAAITITYNRLDLTKKTIESFYAKTSVDYHLFVDNGSTDGTLEFLKNYDRIPLDRNYGIALALKFAVEKLPDCDYILKLDNDVETVTEGIIDKMVFFLDKHQNFAVSPVDLLLDKNYKPKVLKRVVFDGYNVEYVTHTGGAFQLAKAEYVKRLCKDFNHLKQGDWAIGDYYRRIGVYAAYLTDLQMKHIGLNQSSPNYIM